MRIWFIVRDVFASIHRHYDMVFHRKNLIFPFKWIKNKYIINKQEEKENEM